MKKVIVTLAAMLLTASLSMNAQDDKKGHKEGEKKEHKDHKEGEKKEHKGTGEHKGEHKDKKEEKKAEKPH